MSIVVNNRELKMMERDANEICHQTTLPMCYYDDSGWQPGVDSTSTGWSSFKDYYCNINEINELNIKKYPYGNISEGDLVLLIPKNTELPTDKSKYKVKYNNKEYVSKTGLNKSEMIRDTFLHYVLVCELS